MRYFLLLVSYEMMEFLKTLAGIQSADIMKVRFIIIQMYAGKELCFIYLMIMCYYFSNTVFTLVETSRRVP